MQANFFSAVLMEDRSPLKLNFHQVCSLALTCVVLTLSRCCRFTTAAVRAAPVRRTSGTNCSVIVCKSKRTSHDLCLHDYEWH